MVKGGGKSSASSATRKKHALKAAGPRPEDPSPLEKKPKTKEKGKKKEPRPKMYIPPVKPSPVLPDPLETTGLAHTLPADLLVVLRSLSKKAEVTKIRALEDLQSGWVEKCQKAGEDHPLTHTLVDMLPVWLHHLPAFFVHPSRRIRIPPVKDHMFFHLRQVIPSSQLEDILGTWCMSAHDIDRGVALVGRKSWNGAIPDNKNEKQAGPLDPLSVYAALNPTPPVVPVQPPRKGAGRAAPPPPRKEDADGSSRLKSDESEESETDKKARLRVAAFGAIRWMIVSRNRPSATTEDLIHFVSNPALWTSLNSVENSPLVDIESFGFAQPVVRKSCWTFLQTLLQYWNGELSIRILCPGPLLPTLSSAVLGSAWIEVDTTVHQIMWQPLLTFLKRYPQAWELERHLDDIRERNDDDEESEPGDETIAQTSSLPHPSKAYQAFLHFLELGCSGSPTQGYPTVVIILSTIPSSVRYSPLHYFLTSFWAAIDGRALSSLHRSAASAAFLSSLLESPPGSWTAESANEQARKVVQEQFEKVWEEVEHRNLRAEERAAGTILARTLASLIDMDPTLFDAAWDTLTFKIKTSSSSLLVAVVLKTFFDRFSGSPLQSRIDSLLTEVSFLAVDRCESLFNPNAESPATERNGPTQILHLLRNSVENCLTILSFQPLRVDGLVGENAYLILADSPEILFAYFRNRNDEQKCSGIWAMLLSSLSKKTGDALKPLSYLLDAAHQKKLPAYLKPIDDELYGTLKEIIHECSVARQILHQWRLYAEFCKSRSKPLTWVSDHFVSEHGFLDLLEVVIQTFNDRLNLILHDQTSDVTLGGLDLPIDLLGPLFLDEQRRATLPEDFCDTLAPALFLSAFLLPQVCSETEIDQTTIGNAQKLWGIWVKQTNPEHKGVVIDSIKTNLKSMMVDTNIRPMPEQILSMVSQGTPGVAFNLLEDLFPSSLEIRDMLREFSPYQAHSSIAVQNYLVPPMDPDKTWKEPQKFDSRGFSVYARVVGALVRALIEDRQLAKRNLWSIRPALALSVYAQDLKRVPYAENPVFQRPALSQDLESIISKVDQLATYLLTSASDETWRSTSVRALLAGVSLEGLDGLPKCLGEVITETLRKDSSQDTRILEYLLQHTLSDADETEAGLWMQLARKVERNAPQTSMTIVAAVAQYAREPPLLDRYRNEMAAALLGIPASKANEEGLLTLRKLAASAPSPDSDVVFLPQNRAVHVMKACQEWIASDEDMEEQLETVMTLIFTHLAPILQNVPGAHWDLIFDVLESNLETASVSDDDSLVVLARSLKLLLTIKDLVTTNKSLRAAWQERSSAILTFVRDMATVQLEIEMASAPRSICCELVLLVIQDLPAVLIDQDTMPKMCHLIKDTSDTVKTTAYQVLHNAAKRRTEHFVIEAGVDTEDSFKANIPDELVEILQQNVLLDEVGEHITFSYLLGWMLLFDLFEDASLAIRSSYVEQLRSLDIIASHFIPTIINILHLDEGPAKSFKLDVWAVDEYYVEHYRSGSSFSIPVLAAHIYYRALLTIPSLIHAWVSDCKDRQLGSTITVYTTQYFSPVIIHIELAHTKNSSAATELVDENLTIKTAASTNEVIASYLVDEHQLEIKMKIPSDWPLHKIEVEGTKRVGVDTKHWRSWVLAVQQILWSHNGRIVDGIGLFKKNVKLHFEGQVECAICYSIVSVMDGSLPRIPCKTCKNRFHAGCLYKWFSSSHSSSCPLCRSDIALH
ncbi:hypothetical protein BD779DRAFT_1613454 [Infundibulicybe gibba]|nr:hypothetical protein BD779DRAFT_1613454 [Infundibulicybe gibba]